MEKPRILGLDIGDRRTGVALSDESRLLSTPYVVIEAVGRKKWLREIVKVVKRSEAGEIVVAIPLEEKANSARLRRYIELLRDRFTVPVVEWIDLAASLNLDRKAPAATILQNYLDSLRPQPEEN